MLRSPRVTGSGSLTIEHGKLATVPGNGESVGIEWVGRALPDARNKEILVYESVTAEENASLKWLVAELSRWLAVPPTEVFRHPVVSIKTDSEAQSAVWK